jgi:serine/threonine protein kinase
VAVGRGTYELVRHLATGGMAELYLARAPGAAAGEPWVVLKRILPDHARNPAFVAMFLDEARLAARLHHPNIAGVIDVGRTGDTYFYALEYVHGQNLRDVLQRSGQTRRRIPTGVAVAILLGAAAGLHAAHEARGRDGSPLEIVHRDVSPSNLMVAYDGTIKVVDFGVAKAADRMTETRSGTVKGKIAYLSPEQCLLRALDRRSDVFALGVCAWELVTQRRLFKRDSDYESMRAIIEEPLPRPSQTPGVEPALDPIILRALAREPDRRYPTAAAFADELRAVAATLGLDTSPDRVADYVRGLFGSPPLPWFEGDVDVTDTHVISIGELSVDDLLVEPDDGDLAAVPVALPMSGQPTARLRPLPSPARPPEVLASPAVLAERAVVATFTTEAAAPPLRPSAPALRPPRPEAAPAAPVVAAAVGPRATLTGPAPAPVVPPSHAPSPPPSVAAPNAPSSLALFPSSAPSVGPLVPPSRDATASVSAAWAIPTPPVARRRAGPWIAVVAGASIAAIAIAVAVAGGADGGPVEGPALAPTAAVAPAPATPAVGSAAVAPALAPTVTDAGPAIAAAPVAPTPAEPDPVAPTPAEPDLAAPTPVEPDPIAPTPVEPGALATRPRTPLDEVRAAAGRSAREAAEACRRLLASGARDGELWSLCGRMFCATRQAALARSAMRRVSTRRAAEIERQCLASGAFSSATECDDDPTACR